MLIKLTVKVVRLEVTSPMTLTVIHSRSQVRLKLDYFKNCNTSDNISAITFKLGMTVWMPYFFLFTLCKSNSYDVCSRHLSVLLVTTTYTSQCLKWMDCVLLIMNIGA